METTESTSGTTTDTTSGITPAEGYAGYLEPAIFRRLAEVVLRHAPPLPGDEVLDLACGTGIVARLVAPIVGTVGRVVGVDPNPGMLAVARARAAADGLEVEWRQGDGTHLELPDGAFDRVYCQQGLQFFPDRASGAQEMRRVLRGGGTAVVAAWQGPEHHPLYTALSEAEAPRLAALGLPVDSADLQRPFSLGDADELVSLLRREGFRRVELITRSIEARFPTPARFLERLEHAYAAVVPAFTEDPDAFAAYLTEIQQELQPLVDRHRREDEVVVPMHTNIAVAHA